MFLFLVEPQPSFKPCVRPSFAALGVGTLCHGQSLQVVVVIVLVVVIRKLLMEIPGLSMLLHIYSGALSLTRLRRRRTRMVVEMRKKKGNPSRLTSRLTTEHTPWATNPR